MNFIEVERVKFKIDNGDKEFIVLDVREPYEYNICNIDSINIPMAQVSERLSELPKNKHIAVLCKSGKRGQAVANMLITEYGYKIVSVISGGIDEWVNKIDSSLEKY